MLKTLEYAILSNHVYDPEKTRLNGMRISKIKISEIKEFKLESGISWYQIIGDNIDLNSSHSEFYAGLYVKYVLGEAHDAVIAYRGTKTLENKLADAIAWRSDILTNGFFDSHPPYAAQASRFLSQAKSVIQQYFPKASISFTGHSLGGALAQWVVGARAQPYRTITFNAPGIGHMPGIHDNLKHWVLNINSRYGFINKIGKSFGSIDYVDVTNQEEVAKRAWQEIAQVKELETQTKDTVNTLEEIRLLDNLALQEVMARNDVLASWFPQHQLDNLIQAIV